MENITFIKLPKWKAYLYDLQKRWQIYKRIATRKPVDNFSLKPGDKLIIRKCLLRFGKGGSLRKNRAFFYDDFVNLVEKNQSRVLPKEFKIAVKISNIKKLKLESLFMEISELRKFGKEVGLTHADMKGMDEEDLIAAIIKNVDPKTKYSDEFVEWYDDLPEDTFDEDEEDEKPSKKKDKKKSKKNEDDDDDDDDKEVEFDPDEVIEAIEDADSIKELHSIVETYPEVFPEKLLKKKDVESLQETMKGIVEAVIEDAEEEEKSKKKKGKKVKEEDEDEKPKKKAKKAKDEDEDDEDEGETKLSDKDVKKLVKKIEEADDLDELKALVKKHDVFDEVSTRGGKLKVETLKKNMLAALGIEEEDDDEDEKPKAKKKEKKSKKKEVSLADELEDKSSIELKRMAKELGIKVKDLDRDEIIEKIIEAMEDNDDDDDKAEVELNPSLVKEMVKNKDLEGLQEAAESLDITLGSLEKRSCKRIGEKLIEALGEDSDSSKKKSKKKKDEDEDDEDEKPKKKSKEKKSAKTPFMIIEEMVLEEEDEADIIKAVSDFFKEKGKDKKWIKERVKQLIEVVKVQHDLEEDDDD